MKNEMKLTQACCSLNVDAIEFLISSFLSRIFLLHLEMHATKILDADFV